MSSLGNTVQYHLLTYTATTGLLGVTQLTLWWGLDIEMAGIWAGRVVDGQPHKHIQAHLHQIIITNIPIAAQVANRANIFLFCEGGKCSTGNNHDGNTGSSGSTSWEKIGNLITLHLLLIRSVGVNDRANMKIFYNSSCNLKVES